MSDPASDDRREPRFEAGHEAEGKVPAVIAWALFALALPTGWVLALVGVIVAYAGRSSATGLARAHIDAQIRLFWSLFWWTLGGTIAMIISFLTIILIPLGFLLALALFLLTIWFTVKSVLGLLNLLGDRAP